MKTEEQQILGLRLYAVGHQPKSERRVSGDCALITFKPAANLLGRSSQGAVEAGVQAGPFVTGRFWPISALRVRRGAASSGQLMGLRKLGLFTPHISSDMVHRLQGLGSG